MLGLDLGRLNEKVKILVLDLSSSGINFSNKISFFVYLKMIILRVVGNKVKILKNKSLMTNSVSQNAYLEGVTVLTEDGQWKVWHRGQLVPLSGSTEPGGRPGLSTNKSLAAQPLHPTPPMVKKDTAAFYFYPEDEEDVAGLVLPDIGPQTEYSLTKIIQKLLAHYSLSLTEGTLLNLKNIVFVFLRGTRSPVATWELLQASLNTGGTNLAIGVSDTILGFLKELKKKIEGSKGLVMDDWGKVPLAVKPPTSVLPKPVQSLEGVMPQAIKPQAVSTASTAGFRKPLVWQDQKITEVKRSYKLVSPLEELALLNLEMFRKLGDHSAAVQKIREKIVVLGEESIGKGSQAIVAWRKSPLNQMYVKIGQLSLNQGEHVADVINQLTGQGERILTLAEFEAISDLNQALRA